MSLALTLQALVGGAQQPDGDRVEGVVEVVQSPVTVLVRTRDRLVAVDLAALGGVTVSVTPGQKIVAVGTMEPDGRVLHAKHLEAPVSP